MSSRCSRASATAVSWAARRFGSSPRTRKARAKGDPLHVVVHEDVLVFAKPQNGVVADG